MAVKKMEEKQILQGLKEFDEDMDWLSEKQENLRKQFANKYIAVVGRRVIDSDSDLEILLQKLKESGRDPGAIPIEFISKEPRRLIL
jgi:predicted DNA-binding protein (UPF0278 family)